MDSATASDQLKVSGRMSSSPQARLFPDSAGVQALSGATKVFLNVIWLEAQMSQRKVCYDLGPNGTGAGFSKYYFIERQLTRDYWPKVNYFYWDPID